MNVDIGDKESENFESELSPLVCNLKYYFGKLE
jgi:hypothetical protein